MMRVHEVVREVEEVVLEGACRWQLSIQQVTLYTHIAKLKKGKFIHPWEISTFMLN